MKPYLVAQHPDTKEWHRWEVGDKRGVIAGEFMLVPVYGSCAIVGRWRLTSVSDLEYFILRDIGPADPRDMPDWDEKVRRREELLARQYLTGDERSELDELSAAIESVPPRGISSDDKEAWDIIHRAAKLVKDREGKR